jgi:hypothetical protein
MPLWLLAAVFGAFTLAAAVWQRRVYARGAAGVVAVFLACGVVFGSLLVTAWSLSYRDRTVTCTVTHKWVKPDQTRMITTRECGDLSVQVSLLRLSDADKAWKDLKEGQRQHLLVVGTRYWFTDHTPNVLEVAPGSSSGLTGAKPLPAPLG